MNRNKPLKIPPSLLVLDFIGAVLVGLGMAEWLADTNLVPESFRFENYPVTLVICGVILMLPAILHVIQYATGRRQPGS